MKKKKKTLKKKRVQALPERNKYQSLTHVSDILWHFIGPKEFEDNSYLKALKRLESYISKSCDKITLKPYVVDSNFYERVLHFNQTKLGSAVSAKDIKAYQVHEPKAVCFCDIPISHLPLHMKHYGEIGIGIRRRVITQKTEMAIMPVRYFPLLSQDQLKIGQNILWKYKGRKIILDKYTKIPTNLNEAFSPPADHNSELFEQIYQEREWRTVSAVEFTLEELAFILLPSKELITANKFPKLSKLLDNRIGLIIADDLFRQLAHDSDSRGAE